MQSFSSVTLLVYGQWPLLVCLRRLQRSKALQSSKCKEPLFHCVLCMQVDYPEIEEGTKPRHRFMSAYEQRKEAQDKKYQFLLFAADPYEVIAFKIPNSEVDRSDRLFSYWYYHLVSALCWCKLVQALWLLSHLFSAKCGIDIKQRFLQFLMHFGQRTWRSCCLACSLQANMCACRLCPDVTL